MKKKKGQSKKAAIRQWDWTLPEDVSLQDSRNTSMLFALLVKNKK